MDIRMIDVGGKPVTGREASACGRIHMSGPARRALLAGKLPKGDALAAARLAGILAAKRTSAIIPLCHPLPLDSVELRLAPAPGGLRVESTVRCTARTGVEMEALTAVCAACLTVYDMTKSVDPAMTIGPVFLLEKKGGRSGRFLRKDVPSFSPRPRVERG